MTGQHTIVTRNGIWLRLVGGEWVRITPPRPTAFRPDLEDEDTKPARHQAAAKDEDE